MQLPKRKNDHKNIKDFDPHITQTKLDDLKKNLDRMINTVRPKLSAEVKRLAEHGDFSENAEYQMAKGKLRGLNNKIDFFKYQIDHAEIIKPSKDTSRVALGHFVTLEKEGKKITYEILGSFETNPSTGSISDSSPIGSKLLNKKVNDKISVKIGERTIEYKIIKIQ